MPASRLFAAILVLLALQAPAKLPAADGPHQRMDRYGNPLPQAARVRLGSVPFQVEGELGSIAFAPDGRLLAGCDGGFIYFWDVRTAKLICRLPNREFGSRIALSPEGTWVLQGSAYGLFRLRTAHTGRELARFRKPPFDERSRDYALLTSDGKHIVLVPDAGYSIPVANKRAPDRLQVTLHDATNGRLERVLLGNDSKAIFPDAALSPDGKLLAVAIHAITLPQRELKLIELATGRVVRDIRLGGGDWFQAVAFAPDGKIVALGSRDEILLAESATGRQVGSLKANMGMVAFLAFAPDGKELISHSHDDVVRVWDLLQHKERTQFHANAAERWTLPVVTITAPLGKVQPQVVYTHSHLTVLAPDGGTLAVAHGSSVRLWDVRTGKELFPEKVRPGKLPRISAYSPDGRYLVTTDESATHLWDAESGHLLATSLLPGAVSAFSPDSRLLAVGAGGQMTLWDMPTRREFHRWILPGGRRVQWKAVGFNRTGQQLSAAVLVKSADATPDSREVYRWDVPSRRLLGRYTATDEYRSTIDYRYLALSPRTHRVAVGNLGNMAVLDSRDGRLLRLCPGTSQPYAGWAYYHTAFSQDGRLLIGWDEGRVELREVLTGNPVARFDITRDGSQPVKSWPKQSAGPAGMWLAGRPRAVTALALSPSGRFIASAELRDLYRDPARTILPPPPIIRIWDALTGQTVKCLEGNRAGCNSLIFSADGKRLAAGHDNGTVLVWDTPVLATIAPQPRPKLSEPILHSCWDNLGGPDAGLAYTAMARLTASPAATLGFLQTRLQPAKALEAGHVRRLIESLDDRRFARREAATRQLSDLVANEAEPQVREMLLKVLDGKPSPEVRRRVEGILAAKTRPLTREVLQAQRGVQVLEWIGTPQACRLLQRLATGAPSAAVTEDAKAALSRLGQR
ncbi:MAG TPA: hypothetical protein VFA18_13790 [Gemmataceae bacterium]|nr:hypothetical protein [Gemmataceae bacterium]